PLLTRGGLAPQELQLIDGSSVAIRCKPVGDGDRVVGALVWLRRVSGAATTEKTMPASGLLSLTKEERMVAERVVEGLTNPAVAQRLTLSPYSVRSTLRRVFIKFGVRSRVQLARALADELHDSVSQALFSISLHARAVELAAQRDDLDRVARGLAQLRDLTQGALSESVRLGSGPSPKP